MSKTLHELVDDAVTQAYHDGDFVKYAELLRQSVMLEVRETRIADPEAFGDWLDSECEGHQ